MARADGVDHVRTTGARLATGDAVSVAVADVLPALCEGCGRVRTVKRGYSRIGVNFQARLRCQTCRATTEHAVIYGPRMDWREADNAKRTESLAEERRLLAADIATFEAFGGRVEWVDDLCGCEVGYVTRYLDDGRYFLELNRAQTIAQHRTLVDYTLQVAILDLEQRDRRPEWGLYPACDGDPALAYVWHVDGDCTGVGTHAG